MIKLNLHVVKVQLSKYIELVEGGETIIVCKRNIPVAEIRPLKRKEKRTPILGSAAKGARSLRAFQQTMPAAELRLWEGDDKDPLRKYAPRVRKRK